MDIDPNDIDGAYYEKCAEHLQDVMRNEQRENETAQQKALEKYSELDTPFYLHSGISKDAFDYIEFYILFLAILCVAIAAPTFAGEYQTGGDSILRTTKYGHKQLAITKILAAFTLFRCYFPCRDHGTHSDFRCSVRDGLLKNIVSDAILYH